MSVTEKERTMTNFHRPRRLGAALAAVAVMAAAAPAAASAASCPVQATTQLFAPLGDANNYFLAPGGDFEGTNTWTKTGKTVIRMKDGYTTLAGANAMQMPVGGSGTSPAVCVDVDRPHLRLAARADKTVGTLQVDAVLASGAVKPLANLSAANHLDWNLTGDIPLTSPLGVTSTITQQVRLRFTASGGAWSIDGVAVDPRVR